MKYPTFLPRLGLAGAFFAGLIDVAPAATIRVPEDFDRIQRALSAAESGDTIQVGPGTFQENLFIRDAVTIRGAGVGKTILRGPDRQSPVIAGALCGPVVISDLTVTHQPAPLGVAEPRKWPHALHFIETAVELRNLDVNHPAAYGIFCENNLVVMQNISVTTTTSHPVKLEGTFPGSSIDGLMIGLQNYGSQIDIMNGAVSVKNLDPGFGTNSGIQVGGDRSDVKFIDAPATLLERVKWNGASIDGPKAAGVEDYEKQLAERLAHLRDHAAGIQKEYKKALPARRKLARELQSSLKKASDIPQAVAALAEYFPELHATQVVIKNEYNEETDDTTLDIAVRAELQAMHERFGAAGLVAALQLPSRQPDIHLGRYPETILSFNLLEVIALDKADKWAKANIPDLPVILASWANDPASDPTAAADAFLAMLDSIATKSTAGADKARSALRNLALEELSPFIAKRGTAALDRLLRKLALAPPSLVTVDDLRRAVPAEQTIALIRLWKTAQ